MVILFICVFTVHHHNSATRYNLRFPVSVYHSHRRGLYSVR